MCAAKVTGFGEQESSICYRPVSELSTAVALSGRRQFGTVVGNEPPPWHSWLQPTACQLWNLGHVTALRHGTCAEKQAVGVLSGRNWKTHVHLPPTTPRDRVPPAVLAVVPAVQQPGLPRRLVGSVASAAPPEPAQWGNLQLQEPGTARPSELTACIWRGRQVAHGRVSPAFSACKLRSGSKQKASQGLT